MFVRVIKRTTKYCWISVTSGLNEMPMIGIFVMINVISVCCIYGCCTQTGWKMMYSIFHTCRIVEYHVLSLKDLCSTWCLMDNLCLFISNEINKCCNNINAKIIQYLQKNSFTRILSSIRGKLWILVFFMIFWFYHSNKTFSILFVWSWKVSRW